ncbi:hypothetical protein TRFO_09276 [Tritrichomonas foetus]|uniref:SH3 domain-containing protein n=1 Tax=Tritrichomonas foetus TaxID=1144522 RepID=A0A1J4JHW1_9EUKA|nr:hypothetical protein TRFO_09276 [Tritrichomonas foetus]|eukprot:OHS97839.1 hypothetical protein TRFO_09276 [Tritrichomonas foetus]
MDFCLRVPFFWQCYFLSKLELTHIILSKNIQICYLLKSEVFSQMLMKEGLIAIKKLDIKCIGDAQQVDQYFQILSEALLKFETPQIPTLITLMNMSDGANPELHYAIGIPGTMSNALESFSLLISGILKAFSSLAHATHSTIHGGIFPIIEQHKKKIESKIPRIENSIQKYQNLKHAMMELNTPSFSLCNEFALMTNNLLKSNTSVDRNLYQAKFNEVLDFRKGLHKSRYQLLNLAQTVVDSVDNDVKDCAKFYKTSNSTIKELLTWYKGLYSDISNQLCTLAKDLTDKSHKIDWESDFNLYVKENKMMHYDITDLEFIPINTSNPAFYGIDTTIKVNIAPVYPISMALVIEDYIACGLNETSCKKGKNILLMEDVDDDWCYVMNPNTFITGFVPSLCLKKISNTFGIVIREIPNDSSISIGSFVAILNEDNDKNHFLVETTVKQQINIPKALVGITYR